MAGAKFEYDQSGSTYYFLLAFEALVLVPSSYYFYPRAVNESKRFFKNTSCCFWLCLPHNFTYRYFWVKNEKKHYPGLFSINRRHTGNNLSFI